MTDRLTPKAFWQFRPIKRHNVFTPYGYSQQQASSIGFNGEYPQPATGIYLLGLGYRGYRPALMRFISPDSWSPFGDGGLNPYCYCFNDPANGRDSTGHAPSFGIRNRRPYRTDFKKSASLPTPFAMGQRRSETTRQNAQVSISSIKDPLPDLERILKTTNTTNEFVSKALAELMSMKTELDEALMGYIKNQGVVIGTATDASRPYLTFISHKLNIHDPLKEVAQQLPKRPEVTTGHRLLEGFRTALQSSGPSRATRWLVNASQALRQPP